MAADRPRRTPSPPAIRPAPPHFGRVNQHLENGGSPIRYKFNFLTPKDIDTYFQWLREGRIAAFRSELDVKLVEEV
ncbi:MAG TPA: hypothetical protein VLT62_17660 [Candidatus Methylomirabilis sp.]|nr:hypothetical protein [Candidatus Methylomirabilis sp.]